MRTTYRLLLATALCAISGGGAMADDLAGGTGWTLTDEGVLTVGADYEWADFGFTCEDEWKDYLTNVRRVVVEDGVTKIGANAFDGCVNATGITLPESLSEIGNYAFNNCESLSDIRIPANVKSTGICAFEGCAALTGIGLPEGLTEISAGLFHDCESLTSISIPKNVTLIGNAAFTGCSSMKSVELPEGLTKIDEAAFEDCARLGTVAIPKTVKSIGAYAFDGCSSLTAAVIPEGVDTIHYNAFSNCLRLASVVLPKSVTMIEESAFAYCEALRAIELPEGMTEIEWAAFSGCSSLREVKIPGGVERILGNAFADCRSLKTVELQEGLRWIRHDAFNGCSSLEDLTIPSTVTDIDDNAFDGCKGLKSVRSLATTPPSLGDGAFTGVGCKLIVPEGAVEAYQGGEWADYFARITYVQAEGKGWSLTGDGTLTVDGTYEWSAGIASYSTEAWEAYAADVTYVDITDGVTKISPQAFFEFAAVDSVSLAASVKEIGACAFYECTGIKSVASLAATPPALGDNAFDRKVSRLNVPYGAEEAYRSSDWAEYFAEITAEIDGGEGWSLSVDGVLTVREDYEWKGSMEKAEEEGNTEGWSSHVGDIRKAVIGDGVELVGTAAFYECERLTEVRLPESLFEIGVGAFTNCVSLAKIEIPDGVSLIGTGAFADCESLESVSLPKGVTSIEMGTFIGCNKLAHIDIPDEVTTIGQYAFTDCDFLKEVVLPEGLTSVGEEAFHRCADMTSVTCKATEPPSLGDDAFSAVHCPLYVPAEAVEAYKASEWAEYFDEILAIEDRRPTSAPCVTDGSAPAVSVRGGVVSVDGLPAAEVYNLAGRRMPAGRRLPRGLYVVATPRRAVKVAVR
ncbi:MAG: leucine-rich repeat domain-containing protein [Marinilabiliaceae bacterium]